MSVDPKTKPVRPDEPRRHFMPPGDHVPLCGSRERLPYRAIDGKPVTCPDCIVALRRPM